MHDSLEAIRLLPAAWKAEIDAGKIMPVTSGMTQAQVYRLSAGSGDRYLKIGMDAEAAHVGQEVERTKWLASMGIRVPLIFKHFDDGHVAGFIMGALTGQVLEDAITQDNAPPLIAALGRALAKLHALPPAACPFDERLAIRLDRARDLLEAGAIDPGSFDARNCDISAEQLYRRLKTSAPVDEDCVVIHGDASLSNLIRCDDGEIGFVDCGNAGVGDRYVDLAVSVGEVEERVGTPAYTMFAAGYGALCWESQKAAFYSDLYELF